MERSIRTLALCASCLATFFAAAGSSALYMCAGIIFRGRVEQKASGWYTFPSATFTPRSGNITRSLMSAIVLIHERKLWQERRREC